MTTDLIPDPMTIPVELRSSALIRGSSDGTWQPAEEDGFDAMLIPIYTFGNVVHDVVAYEWHRPTVWWLRWGRATFAGEHELILAARDKRPTKLVATPREWLHHSGLALCILDWSADVRAILAQAPNGIVCDSEALARRARQTAERITVAA